jgi:3-oxoacyl-[acyl-carrier protein] reductase
MNNLRGKVALVTGGGTGIGRGIATALAQEGVVAAVCGRRIDQLESTVKLIREMGNQALAVRADVSEETNVLRLVKTILERYGTIDILVNNAGIYAGAPLHELGTGEWDQVMGVNLRGPFLLTREVLPAMRAQHSGHIINISSESGMEFYSNDAAYGTSKHALNAFGEYTQRENQDYNIRVNTICPGMVVSEMSENSDGLDHSKCLYPEDIADLVIWLLTRRPNIKIGTPILIQTMQNPWT